MHLLYSSWYCFAALKADRKRLKAEKVELLGQMKQLYVTLEDKEGELRDFIRNYEQRMKDSEDNIKQVHFRSKVTVSVLCCIMLSVSVRIFGVYCIYCACQSPD